MNGNRTYGYQFKDIGFWTQYHQVLKIIHNPYFFKLSWTKFLQNGAMYLVSGIMVVIDVDFIGMEDEYATKGPVVNMPI